MPLTSGTRLGPFELVAPIGAGGMGEVYKARDTRLQRDVAIKVLPAAVTTDPDRRARFEREAQAVAALNHPNILAIHETGETDGVPYIVTELLDGETLRERLERGVVPVRKAIDVAVQIARGLAAAHEKGLVHRDLKPENVFLLSDGQAKILDFGLARPVPGGSGATATAALTDAGTAMGTVGYMSPEQVRGQAVDARTDLFALGTVVYEMLTGQRAFQRSTTADTISAILNEDPPESAASRPDLPPALDRIVRHCLEKNPAERFQTARDVAFALAAFSGTSASAASGIVPRVTTARHWRRIAAPAVVGLIAIAATALVDRAMRPAPAPVTFQARTWDPQWITNARFARDGETVVFSAAPTGNVPQLFVIRPGAVISEPIGEPGMHLLSISSTGQMAVLTDARAAYLRAFRGTLARMTIDSGPRPLLRDVIEADWSPDGSQLAITRTERGAYQVEYPIGQVLYRRSSGYVSDIRVSPDGTRVAFFDHQLAFDDRGWVKVVDTSGVVKPLTREYVGLEGLAWSADGRDLVFSAADRDDDAYQVRVVNTTGTPAVAQPFAGTDSIIVRDVGRDGSMLIVRDDERRSIRALVPGEAAERELPWLDVPGGGWLLRNSRAMLFTDQSKNGGENYAVMLRAIDSGKVTRLGDGTAGPFSPDGQWTAALLPSTGDLVLYPTGAGEALKLPRGPIEHYVAPFRAVRGYAQWFPDGRLLVCGNEAGRPPRCYEQRVPSGLPKAVTPEGVTPGPLSDDGRTLLLRTTTGSYEAFVIGGGTPVPVKGITGEDIPVTWTPDRRAVVVCTRDVPARLERVDVTTGVRTLVKELAPPDRAGVTSIAVTQWIDGGRGYVYGYTRNMSKLFVVRGAGR